VANQAVNDQEKTPGTFYDLPSVSADRAQAGKLYLEFLRVPAMSAGVYVLAAGAADPQKPHHEDELYYVVRGRAKMVVASEEQVVKSGSVIFVPANVEHRFFDISEELEVLVFFAPAETA
jgi:mannose-6-phosphate isomerase-like protein (cupin superfamily)